jgi:hypothetical protein
VEQVRGDKLADVRTPNPVAFEEAEKTIELVQAALPPMPEALVRQIAMDTTTTIACIGEETSIFAVAEALCRKSTFDQDDVQRALMDACGHDDDFFAR